MSNDLTQFTQGGLPSDPAQLKAGLQQARQSAPSTIAGVQFMKMNQFGSPQEGVITYGAAATEMQENSRWAINWQGLMHGYILRDGASVNAEVYESVFKPLPTELRPVKGGEQWRQAFNGQLVCVSGEDVGVIVAYSGDAGGVIKFYKMLLPAIESQIDVDPQKLYPVVTFNVDHYYSNKQKKEIYEATGTLVDWMGQADMDAIAEKVQTAPETAAPVATAEAPAPAAQASASTQGRPPAQTVPEGAGPAAGSQRTAGRRRQRAAS